jgi:8-oxo-dGTP pyrophosphatase MutT (NUDIX family)
MSAPTPFDDTPSGDARFYAGLPTKHVAAGWLFQDAAGRVLLVQPAYKDSWEIPGGGVEEGESPGEAARRELREELGLDRQPGPLLCVDWRPAVDGTRSDALRFVFDGGVIDEDVTSSFELDPSELLGWEFVAPHELGHRLKPAMARRIRHCLGSASPMYLEDGRPLHGDEVS